MQTVVVATNNLHKVDEIRSAFPTDEWRFVTLEEAGIESEPDETGETFLENARIKARAARALTGRPTIADDSGLEVDVLDGRPGVFSARYAGEGASTAACNEKLLAELIDVPDEERTARFRSVLVYIDADGTETIAEGTCEGSIATTPRGDHGFGYDPVFLPDETPGKTMAELTMEQKNDISHRGAALRALVSKLTAL